MEELIESGILHNKPGLPSLFPTSEKNTLSTRTSRININVPFAEKEEVKRLGARWDRYKKTWYVPDELDASAFNKWLDVPHGLTETEIRMQFINALHDAGLVLNGDPVMDGTWQRTTVTTSSKIKSLKGAYVAQWGDLADGKSASGYIQNFDTGFATAWFPKGLILSNEVQRQFEKQAEEYRQLRTQELAVERKNVAQRLQEKWDSLPNAEAHPYLERKQVKSFGLKLDGQNLVTPLCDSEGKIWSLQYISSNQKQIKLYEKGGHKTGHFHVLGCLESSSVLLVAEGYATCASLHMATGLPVVEAFDSGNMLPVLSALKPHFQDKTLVICGDDDQLTQKYVLSTLNKILTSEYTQSKLHVEKMIVDKVTIDGIARPLVDHQQCSIRLEYTDGVHGVQRIVGELVNHETGGRVPILINNVGREKALDAAATHQALAIFPEFTSLEGRPTDFNDLHVREGIDKVRKQLDSTMQHLLSRNTEDIVKLEMGEDARISLPQDNQRYIGKVIANTSRHSIQDVGRKTAISHDLEKLDQQPSVGSKASIAYEKGRGFVQNIDKHRSPSIQR